MGSFSSTNTAGNRIDTEAGARYLLQNIIVPGAFTPEGMAAFKGLADQVLENGRDIQRNWERVKVFTDNGATSLHTGTNMAITGDLILTAGTDITITQNSTTKVFTINSTSGSSTSAARIQPYLEVCYHFHGTDASLDVALDAVNDWRELAFLCHSRIADTLDNLRHFVDDPDVNHTVMAGTNATYPAQFSVAGDNQFLTGLTLRLDISSTGSATAHIENTSGGSTEGYIYLFLGVYSRVLTAATANVGNGL